MRYLGKTLSLVLVLIFLSSLVMLQPATVKSQTKTITVPTDYPNIHAAIDQANAGDTVFVKNGIYNLTGNYAGFDALIINKPISLIGENNEQTVIVTKYWKYISAVIKVNADGVTISRFNVTNGGDSYGIFVGGSGCRILNNKLDCVISSSGSNNLVSGNSISNTIFWSGIDFESSNNGVISNNDISNCGSEGILIDSSRNVTIKQNTVVGNGNGVFLGPSGPYYVYDNNITDNSEAGVKFDLNCSNSLMYNNNVSHNMIGFSLTNQSQPSVGVGNSIYHNNIIDNQKNALIEQANSSDMVSWDNGVVGNYWSDYNGKGSYVIDENNVDHHPLTQQVNISSIAPTPTTNVVPMLAIAVTVVVLAVVVSLLLYRRHRRETRGNTK